MKSITTQDRVTLLPLDHELIITESDYRTPKDILKYCEKPEFQRLFLRIDKVDIENIEWTDETNYLKLVFINRNKSTIATRKFLIEKENDADYIGLKYFNSKKRYIKNEKISKSDFTSSFISKAVGYIVAATTFYFALNSVDRAEVESSFVRFIAILIQDHLKALGVGVICFLAILWEYKRSSVEADVEINTTKIKYC